MRAAAATYLHNSLSYTTRASYASAVRTFLCFCTMHNIEKCHNTLPIVTEDTLILFVCHCATNLKLSYKTIKLYLCGIRNHYIESLGINPLVTGQGTPFLCLTQVMRGIKKSHPTTGRPRLPITIDILARMCHALRCGIFGNYIDSLMEACCTMAFFGFLRCGEFTYPSQRWNAQDGICLGDISFYKDKQQVTYVSLLLRHSKTDPFRQGQSVLLFYTHKDLCPVRSLQNYLAQRYTMDMNPDSPLFLLPNRFPLTRAKFLSLFQHVLKQIGTPAQGHTGHSFRIGAGTHAAASNIPDHLIQTLGRWSSDCYQTYIKTPISLIKQAQQKMAGNTTVL